MPTESPASVLPSLGGGERTVTFLFTDIERSTLLSMEEPEGMRTAVEAHDDALRPLFQQHQGHIFRALGDAFYVAFETVSDALRAALAAQTALIALTEAHPERPEVRVRMAIHTGEARPRDGDYFGLALNRTARLLDAVHGGQVAATAVAAQLAAEGMPTGAALCDLGLHSLRDFPVAESVFQLIHSSLPRDFPPLRTGTATPHNLPRQLTSFVGRESEAGKVRSLLLGSPLVTLTGAGGCGKTRLSLEVAGTVLEEFPGGVWFADLSSVRDAALIEQTVAAAVEVRPPPGRTPAEGLRDRLRAGNAPSLLILDNCEQVVEGCAFFAALLLQDCPHLHLLATSREALGIAGETVWMVPTLRVPEKTTALTLAQLLQSEAVRLFVERARAATATFAPTEEDVPFLLSICRQLDGIPLALEIAASWSAMLGPRQIAERIEDRFKLLRAASGSRTALPRQRTLRGAIEGSYDLLTEGERALMRRLSVFRGGWTLKAAEAVCAALPDENEDLLICLYQLIRKSLVVAEPHREDITRFRFLETIGQYAQEMLDTAGEIPVFYQRHQAYFAALAEEAQPKLSTGEQSVWLNRLEREHDNLRASLQRDCGGDKETRLHMACLLTRFWMIRGFAAEGRRFLIQLQDELAHEDITPSLKNRAANGAGVLSLNLTDFETAQRYFEQVLEISRELNDSSGIGTALANLGYIAYQSNDLETVSARYEESAELMRRAGDQARLTTILVSLGAIQIKLRRFQEAEAILSEVLVTQRENGDEASMVDTLFNLGIVALRNKDYASVRGRFAECLNLSNRVGDKTRSLPILSVLVELAVEERQFEEAARLVGAFHQGLGVTSSVLSQKQRLPIKEDTQKIQSALGGKLYDKSYAVGHEEGFEKTLNRLLQESNPTVL